MTAQWLATLSALFGLAGILVTWLSARAKWRSVDPDGPGFWTRLGRSITRLFSGAKDIVVGPFSIEAESGAKNIGATLLAAREDLSLEERVRRNEEALNEVNQALISEVISLQATIDSVRARVGSTEHRQHALSIQLDASAKRLASDGIVADALGLTLLAVGTLFAFMSVLAA